MVSPSAENERGARRGIVMNELPVLVDGELLGAVAQRTGGDLVLTAASASPSDQAGEAAKRAPCAWSVDSVAGAESTA